MTAAVAFGFLLVVLASGYHAVTEHHVHRKVLHLVNPRVTVPETRHDTRWHAMGHWQRAGVNASMCAAAAALGLAWRLEPRITTTCVIIALGAGAAWIAARSASTAIGRRHRPAPDEEDD